MLSVQGRLTVAAVTAAAERAGIAPGMALADARALLPALNVVPADPAGDAKALAGLADWCGRYTPWTAVDGVGQGGGAGGLVLEVAGSAHLFGGEAGLLADLVACLHGLGFAATAAVADTAGAAWAAARFLAGPRGSIIVEPGQARALIGPLPVLALRLDPVLAAGLIRLGLARVEDLYGLPRAALAARFGPEPGRRLDQMLGGLDEPISPRLPAPELIERLAFPEPIAHADDIARGARRLLERLCAGLEARGRGARRLELTLYRVDGTLERACVGTARAAREAGHLGRLFAEHLGRLDPGFGVEAMTLAAPRTEPLGATQLALPGVETRHEPAAAPEALAALIDRLGNRLGPGSLRRLAPYDSHIPERAVHAVPALAPRAPGRWEDLPARPLRLLPRPEAIEAVAPVPDHPPVMFRWRRVPHRVRAARGPERIAPEWWREPGRAAARTRDYFQVEDTDGGRFWLYREGLYGASSTQPRWYLHGVFA
ncbi:MAG: DNA polymerase Y family protein [Kiloniellales bacterium]